MLMTMNMPLCHEMNTRVGPKITRQSPTNTSKYQTRKSLKKVDSPREKDRKGTERHVIKNKSSSDKVIYFLKLGWGAFLFFLVQT